MKEADTLLVCVCVCVHKPGGSISSGHTGRSVYTCRLGACCLELSDVFQPEQETIRVPFNRIISEQLSDVYYYYLCILHQ